MMGRSCNMPEAAESRRPMSPCLNICTLGDDNVCLGCFRSLEEIVGWARMTAAEQHATIARAKGRSDSRDEVAASSKR